jgi:hypothetical protein
MKKNLARKLLYLSTLFFAVTAQAGEVHTARIFDIGKTSGSARFNQETHIETKIDGEVTWSSEIKDDKGTVVMTEKATIKNDRTIYQYIEQLQINEAYELQTADSKATFSTFKIENGKKGSVTETKTVSIGSDFLTGPSTGFYLKSHWDELISGKTLMVEFGIFELSRTIGFKFQKMRETDTSVELQMKPSNFFISFVAEPILMEFDKKDKRLVRFKGRTPLRERVHGKWKPLDAEILYP